MKVITNWRNATVSDIEADALLDDATKIHVLSYEMQAGGEGSFPEYERITKFFKYHLDNKIPIVMHNGIGYDVPLVEKLLGLDLSGVMLIDTLSVSWYLNTERMMHGLDSFFADYGIAKPKVGNHRWAAPEWEPWLTESGYQTRLKRHYKIMKHRCSTDVKINKALWEDLKERLVSLYSRVKDAVDKGLADGTRMSDDEVCYIDQYKHSSSVDDYVDRILTFLMFKADCARLKEKTRFKTDVPALESLIEDLSEKTEAAKLELESVMPQVPQYTKKNRPAKPFKKNGSKSASGLAWDEEVAKVGIADEQGNVLVKQLDVDTLQVLKGYEPPNINGHQQIKDFLFSKGWKPISFKFVKDEVAQQKWADSGFKPHLKPKPRAIPQISVEGEEGKELCPSVIELAEAVPEIMAYAKYTTIKHRLDMCKGFKRDLREGGYLCARVGGYTNTLREQHRELVNLPSVKKPLGKEIRGLLIAPKGSILLGSDMSALEDRVKHHFMLAHDPEYVKTMMAADYDPHLTTALASGLITITDFQNYMSGKKEAHVVAARAIGKSTNYAAVYGSGAETLARTSGMSVAQAKISLEGYWKLNWSVKAIADEQCVVTDASGKMWLVNPINGFAYSLRGEKDRFSTLCQGTGSYFFDMWVDEVLSRMQEKFGVKRLSAEFHDEFVTCFRETEGNKESMKNITEGAIEALNERYNLRRKLGCDVQFGYKYSDIH